MPASPQTRRMRALFIPKYEEDTKKPRNLKRLGGGLIHCAPRAPKNITFRTNPLAPKMDSF
ncbi:hypothetical protein AGR6A_Cc60496 [Agrobacterium sp. NCPPB 925]|nr:hypothetical protein AGR6A_Cc60496 [Agrobacterium sp. NCPPB 925]